MLHNIKNAAFKSSLARIPQQSARFQSSQFINPFQHQSHSLMYQRIKSMVSKKKNSQSLRKKSVEKQSKSKQSITNFKVIVRSEQQKQLMGCLGPQIFPILVDSPQQKKTKKRMKSNSTLDVILSNRQKFMKTYFADLKNYKNEDRDDEISYIFPQIGIGKWRVTGYIKGKFILLKGVYNKRKQIFKKYLYSQASKQIRRNYEQWVKNHFLAEAQQYL